MVVEILVVIAALLLGIAGLIGCIVPVLPGPPVSYGGMLLLALVSGWLLYSPLVLILTAIAAVAAVVLDSIIPPAAGKRAGAGRGGVWGSVVGMLLGTIFFPPFGVILGAFLGAWLGELVFNRDNTQPVQAALAVLRGTMVATVVKLAVSGVIMAYIVYGSIQLIAG